MGLTCLAIFKEGPYWKDTQQTGSRSKTHTQVCRVTCGAGLEAGWWSRGGWGLRTGDLDLNLGAGVYKQWDLGQQCPTTSAGSYPTLVEFFTLFLLLTFTSSSAPQSSLYCFLHRSTQKTKSLEIAFMWLQLLNIIYCKHLLLTEASWTEACVWSRFVELDEMHPQASGTELPLGPFVGPMTQGLCSEGPPYAWFDALLLLLWNSRYFWTHGPTVIWPVLSSQPWCERPKWSEQLPCWAPSLGRKAGTLGRPRSSQEKLKWYAVDLSDGLWVCSTWRCQATLFQVPS